jgi:hypothetical protein
MAFILVSYYHFTVGNNNALLCGSLQEHNICIKFCENWITAFFFFFFFLVRKRLKMVWVQMEILLLSNKEVNTVPAVI